MSRVVKAIDWAYTTSASEYKDRIMEGPIACAVDLKEDFFYYKGGVYTPVMGKDMGYYGVVLCGWNAQGQWLFKSSWGTGEEQFMWTSQTPDLAVWLVVEPTNQITLDKYEFDEPNDNLWNPGESINIIATLKSKGTNFTNVTGALSTTDSAVNIINSISNFGVIPNDSSVNNSTNPFKAIAKSSATEHDVSFALAVTADTGEAYLKYLFFILPIGKTGIEEETSYRPQVAGYRLQIYPNPFIQKTEIRFQIPDTGNPTSNISLKIYDVVGRLIRTLVDEEKNPGYYTLRLDMSKYDDIIAPTTSGIYFAKLVAGDYTITKKLILLK